MTELERENSSKSATTQTPSLGPPSLEAPLQPHLQNSPTFQIHNSNITIYITPQPQQQLFPQQQQQPLQTTTASNNLQLPNPHFVFYTPSPTTTVPATTSAPTPNIINTTIEEPRTSTPDNRRLASHHDESEIEPEDSVAQPQELDEAAEQAVQQPQVGYGDEDDQRVQASIDSHGGWEHGNGHVLLNKRFWRCPRKEAFFVVNRGGTYTYLKASNHIQSYHRNYMTNIWNNYEHK